jgi:hypothetical protein
MAAPFARYDAFPHAPIALWHPQFPPGRLEQIYLHWSGGDYEAVSSAYHFCIANVDGVTLVVQTHDLRANMRDVREGDAPYAAHTAARNSYAAGIAVMAMRDARPDDFGAYPLVDDAVSALCTVTSRVAAAYGVPLDVEHVMTHAEAAIIDGYFGASSDGERWDIARLVPAPLPLTENDARVAGDTLRARCRG